MKNIKDADFRSEKSAIRSALWNMGCTVAGKTYNGDRMPEIDDVYSMLKKAEPETAVITRRGHFGRINDSSGRISIPADDSVVSPVPVFTKKRRRRLGDYKHFNRARVDRRKIQSPIKIYNLGKLEELPGIIGKCDWGRNIEIGIEECGHKSYNAWQITKNWDKRYAHRLLNPSDESYDGIIYIDTLSYHSIHRFWCVRQLFPRADIYNSEFQRYSSI